MYTFYQNTTDKKWGNAYLKQDFFNLLAKNFAEKILIVFAKEKGTTVAAEASLVKKLEELGIGRPSTYASIVSVIKDKGYVKYEKRRFEPETKGRIVTAFLNGYFSNYIEENFTAKLEDQLDNISNGKENWKDTLQKWWLPFKSNIDDASSLRVRDVEKRIDNDLGPHFFPQSEDGSDPRKCPKMNP